LAADTVIVSTWRTKAGPGPVVEHPSKDAADAAVDAARGRYRAGARALRVVRLYSPDGEVRLIDFGLESRTAQRALQEVQRATERKDRELRAAVERWESAVVAAVQHGEDVQAVADAAGLAAEDVTEMLRRHGTAPS
jgi:hypothetical protein